MVLTLDMNGQMPIYEQIQQELIRMVIEGELEKGEQLPSVRQFASDLAINLHTVNKAYKNLENEGWVTINRKKGAFINPDMDRIKMTYKEDMLLEQLEPLLRLYNFLDGDEASLKSLISKFERRS